MITPGDVVIALSNSGETGEVLTILPLIKRMHVPLVSMTGKTGSTLARMADVNLDVGVAQEACPLNLAPTSSTTAALAMGDALAVALLEARGFTPEDFALSHPGGSLGRRLLLMVEDVMVKGDGVPRVAPEAALFDALFEITRKGLGMTCVVDAGGALLGVFTDGDLRRTLDHDVNLRATPIREVMNARCTTVRTGILAAECLRIMEEKKINGLVVVDEANRPVGVLNMLTLLRAGVF
jgi:arabinose-5-phosphate isomerase